jgi:hypothetical protein
MFVDIVTQKHKFIRTREHQILRNAATNHPPASVMHNQTKSGSMTWHDRQGYVSCPRHVALRHMSVTALGP